MKEQLIEKLKDSRDHIKGRTQSINVALKFEELEWLLQALTSVKSAEEVPLLQKALNEYINLRHTQEECIGFIDGFKKAMHDFANNSEAMKEGAIIFGNHLKAYFKIVGNKIEILDAVNGWGDNVQTTEIKVEYLTNKEK